MEMIEEEKKKKGNEGMDNKKISSGKDRLRG